LESIEIGRVSVPMKLLQMRYELELRARQAVHVGSGLELLLDIYGHLEKK